MGDDKDHKGHEDHDGDDGPQTPPSPPIPPGPPPSGNPLDTSPQAIAAHNANVDRLATLSESDLRRVLRAGLGPYNPHSRNVTDWMIAAI